MYQDQHSEEQPKSIGSCPRCDTELFLIDGKVAYHQCYPEPEDVTRAWVKQKLTSVNLVEMMEDILFVGQHETYK